MMDKFQFYIIYNGLVFSVNGSIDIQTHTDFTYIDDELKKTSGDVIGILFLKLLIHCHCVFFAWGINVLYAYIRFSMKQ